MRYSIFPFSTSDIAVRYSIFPFLTSDIAR